MALSGDDDLEGVRALVDDAIGVLTWAARSDSRLSYRYARSVRLVDVFSNSETLLLYQGAIEEAGNGPFALARRTLVGGNESFGAEIVLGVVVRAGWTGRSRAYKEHVLKLERREEVMARVRDGGRLWRRTFRRFLRALNVALDSLTEIPGVAAIKELKEFLEVASSRPG